MPESITPAVALAAWKTVLGERPELGAESPGRPLWPVTAEDGRHWFLKRLGPWRNLPLADEARILRHLATNGIPVAEFLPTDHAMLYAGEIADSFVLMPRLPSDQLTAADLVTLEGTIGGAMAALHRALASYPWPVNSYTESLDASLAQDLMLPDDIAEVFAARRDRMIAALTNLPTQLVHGDMTPENVLVQRPGTVAGFIDFDHLPLAPRIWDIAKYLSRHIRLRWRSGADSGRLDHLPGFLRGYHAAYPLAHAEIAALPSTILTANVLEVSYYREISAGTLPRRKLPDHDDVLADTTEAAAWHLTHFEEVAAAVTSSFA